MKAAPKETTHEEVDGGNIPEVKEPYVWPKPTELQDSAALPSNIAASTEPTSHGKVIITRAGGKPYEFSESSGDDVSKVAKKFIGQGQEAPVTLHGSRLLRPSYVERHTQG